MQHDPNGTAGPPRVLAVELGAPERSAGPVPWSPADPALERLARFGGGALALAWVEARARDAPDEATPLVLAVGGAVRDGLPTAARLTVAGRSPLTGLWTEGLVGGELARRLASFADALVLTGRAPGGAGNVLVIGKGGSARLEPMPELAGTSGAEADARLRARFGPAGTLAVGPAGERGSPLASLSSGGDPPHFVGRGGLGGVLAARGLKALVVTAAASEPRPNAALLDALARSPRLEARASGGTLELFDAAAVHADGEVEPRAARAVAEERDGRRASRHGCVGCPTPCGWTFRRPDGREQGARFGAALALGADLGLEGLDGPLELLARCDAIGVDAKEVGAGLAALCEARERGLLPGGPARGRLAVFVEWLEELASAAGIGARLDAGAERLAQELGVPDAVRAVRGSAVRARTDPGRLLGQCVATRGSDPMRAFPFLASDGGESARIAELIAPLALPPGASDPGEPAGKGRLVWWHENLAAAVDATGFCAFSAAGLVADGACDVDRLAEWIAPRARELVPGATSPGAALLALGAATCHLSRRLDERWSPDPDPDRPAWARPVLDRPGLYDEYAALRGLGPDGRLTDRARAAFDRREPVAPAALLAAAAPDARGRGPRPSAPAEPARDGACTLRGGGSLARRLGADLELRLPLPASVEVVLRAAARERDAADELFRGGRALPAVFRRGRRLATDALVHDGDRLDLLLVIRGG